MNTPQLGLIPGTAREVSTNNSNLFVTNSDGNDIDVTLLVFYAKMLPRLIFPSRTDPAIMSGYGWVPADGSTYSYASHSNGSVLVADDLAEHVNAATFRVLDLTGRMIICNNGPSGTNINGDYPHPVNINTVFVDKRTLTNQRIIAPIVTGSGFTASVHTSAEPVFVVTQGLSAPTVSDLTWTHSHNLASSNTAALVPMSTGGHSNPAIMRHTVDQQTLGVNGAHTHTLGAHEHTHLGNIRISFSVSNFSGYSANGNKFMPTSLQQIFYVYIGS